MSGAMHEESSSSSASSALASLAHAPIVQSWNSSMNQKRRRTLPELLASRQTVGKPSAARVGSFERRGVPLDLLSSRSAWNSRRMQNMILVVGPSTPASLLMNSSAPSLSSSSVSASEESEAEHRNEAKSEEEEDVHHNMEEEEETTRETRPPAAPVARSRWARRTNENDSQDERDSDVDDDDNDDDDDDDEDEDETQQILESALLNYYQSEESESEEDDDQLLRNNNTTAPKPVPSMRHGGCINTASWMDCGWKISTAGMSRDAVSTEECPTQLVTSGDDLSIKFWDVSHAMGMTSPISGGYSTICPFAAPEGPRDVEPITSKWRRYYSTTHSDEVSGTVLPLATLSTGHMNNIFHVTPLRGQPGKVATCAMDGFLRLTDLETGQSRAVVSPEREDDMGGLLPVGLMSLRPAMCFSHHFLSRNTGLVCTERGLRRFDLRLPPREQSARNLLGGSWRGCKACAIWSVSKSTSSLEEGDSAYIFAGGASSEVALCDLRMTDDISTKIVQKYCPRSLSASDGVSVSGLDLSKDGQELLVSYESDQVYTFPVFPLSNSAAGPTVDDIGRLSGEGETKILADLACYGGHLNRFTFLKNAKYAGPRDEYICTGSDSGRAWIYEKSTGSVVSFLNADHSTCNGVIPHPRLPFFITYGIDSTAKLWRASTPVDPNVDDSAEGRQKYARKQQYEMSATVQDWESVQKHLRKLDCDEVKDFVDLLPDQIPCAKDMQNRGRFAVHLFRDSSKAPRLGNDLHNLPTTLLKNYYDCIRGILRDDSPIESGPQDFKHRISLIRLRHQADRLGLRWNPSLPWQFELPTKSPHSHFSVFGEMHPADLVPDFPSDWIPYDPEMTKSAWDFNNYFNKKEYEGFYTERYSELMCDERFVDINDVSKVCEGNEKQPSSVDKEDQHDEDADQKVVTSSDEQSSQNEDLEPRHAQSVYNNLHETMKLLKDAGNQALQEGDLDLAARRYDKAIRYGAVALMSFPARNLDFVGGRKELLKENGGYHVEWGPLIRVLIVTRLNLSLLLLKPHFERRDLAAEQAQLALHDLAPFCAKKGTIMKGTKVDKVHRDDEPEETYLDAMTLQAKAYFRLGAAQYDLGDYCEAILSFENSVRSTKEAKAKPDNLVLRRLLEAKREKRLKGKRHRKKFKFAFASNENNKNG